MNILFITSDQQRADCYGFEGRKVKTPHLDMQARVDLYWIAAITWHALYPFWVSV